MKRLTTAVVLLALGLTAPAAGDTAQDQPLDDAAATVQAMAKDGHGSRTNRLAWAIHSYVHRHVTSRRLAQLPADQTPTTPADALRLGAGSCGTKIQVALAIADRVGLRARPIDLYYANRGAPASHATWEAWIGGWRFFDTHFNAVYRTQKGEQMSFARLWRLSPRERVRSIDTGGDRWRDHWHKRSDPWWHYLTARPDVVVDGVGTVTAWRVGNEWPTVPDRPSYFGVARGQSEGRFTQLSLRYIGLSQPFVTVQIAHTNCNPGEVSSQSQITSSVTVTPESTSITLAVQGPTATLSVSGCAVVIARVH
jgi:hypothetical protein